MKAAQLAFLEKAFAQEISAAVGDGAHPRCIQNKGKSIQALVEAGMLSPVVEVWKGIRLHGYELTHLGRMTYCGQCTSEEKET